MSQTTVIVAQSGKRMCVCVVKAAIINEKRVGKKVKEATKKRLQREEVVRKKEAGTSRGSGKSVY